MKKIPVFLALSFLVQSIAFPQWQVQNAKLPDTAIAGPFSTIGENICWSAWTTTFTGSSPILNGYVRTTDGGNTWKWDTIPGTRDGSMYWIEAMDANTAFVAVENYYTPNVAGIFKTTDGGGTWKKHPVAFSNSSSGPGYVHFFDSKNGVAVGEVNQNDTTATCFEIYTTADTGATWSRVLASKIPSVYFKKGSVNEFLDPTSVGSCGDCVWLQSLAGLGHEPRIYRTTDMGHNWSVLDPGFINPDSGTFLDEHKLGVAYQNEDTGFVIGFSGSSSVLKKTSDGGTTWDSVPMPLDVHEFDINYVPGTEGTYVIAGDNNFYGNGFFHGSAYTPDGGATWKKIDDGNYVFLKFVSPNVGWSSHWGSSSIYKFTGSLTAVSTSASAPNRYSLEQNFPNPFNPSTTISYQLAGNSHVTLRVYDILGREVATLVDENKSAGAYQAKFDGSGCASGVYFYRLEAGLFSSVKKFVLMK